MKDPKRWTDSNTDSTELERELVTAGQQERLSQGLKREIWSALAQATLPLSPSLDGGSGGTSAGTTSSLLQQLSAGKLLLSLALLGAASSGAYWALGRAPAGGSAGDAASVRSSASLASAPASAAVASQAISSPEPADAAAESLGGAPSSSVAAPPPRTLLREEAEAVLEIRRVLRAGDAASALRLLERARVRFARPVLGQEREALMIEALARSGARDAAERRATAFLRAYPKSPHAADVRAFTAR